MLRIEPINRQQRLLVATILLSFAWNVPAALGQTGIILPNLADLPNMLPDTNSDITETAGTDNPSATASIGFDLAGVPIVPQPGGAGGIESVDKLVNNITAGDPADNQAKWLDFQGNDIMMPVHVTLTAPAIVNYYTLTSANDAPDRDPWRWRVLGTNVANPTMVSEFTVLESRSDVLFSARDQTQLYSFTNNTAYTTYRFEFETHEVAVPGWPTAGNYDSIQLAEIELFNGFQFAGLVLTIDRTTGGMTITNGSANPISVLGYSITSAKGTLNSSTWLSITNNYDGDSGGGTPLDTDNWIRLTANNGRHDLSEVENPNGTNGATLAAGQILNLGTAWIKYPTEDVLGEILLADGTTQALTVNFQGGAQFVFGDLNFSGGATPITVADWTAFKAGHGFNFATAFSAAESYAKGDLDSDFDWDMDDFGIFKATFDAANGAGAFEAMVASIPEPTSIALFAIASALVASLRNRRIALIVLVGVIALHGGNQAQAGEVITGLIGGDLTNPDNAGAPDVTITAGDAANSPMNEQPANVLDNDVNTKWLAFQPNGTFYQMQFNGGAQHAVNTYTITSANDAAERDAYRWTLSGSNDGTNFVVVDAQSAQVFTARAQTQKFLVANTTPYNYYKFDFLTKLGAGGFNPGAPNSIQMAEIELVNDPDPDILTLEVNVQTGSLRLANNSDDTIPFDAYRIRSATGALNFANWSGGTSLSNNGGQSLHDLNLPGFPRGNGTGNGWEEALVGSSDFDLTELYLGTGGVGVSQLGTEQGITMNNVFRTAGAHDLTFEYRSFGQNVRGFVEYIGAPMGVPGDYNGNNVVDTADYVLWRNGGPLQNEVDTPGVVNAADYTAWRARFGNNSGSGSGAAVPEPSAALLVLLASSVLLFSGRTSKSRVRSSVRPFEIEASRLRRSTMSPGTRKSHFLTLAVAAVGCMVAVGLASASTLDRNYQFSGNANDSAGSADNLTENGGPTYVNVQALGRPGAAPGELGLQLNAASSQYLNGLGLGSPAEGAPIGSPTYPTNRWMAAWVRPTQDTGARQEVISDTFQFGLFVTATDTWGHTYGSAGQAPANLGDDFNTNSAVAFNQWTHLMQRTFGNGGVAVYINGVAVSRFNAGYTASTIAVAPTPDRNMYVGAGSGGATNFYTGQIDNLKLGIFGNNTAQGGQDWTDFNLGVDNDFIANLNLVNGDVNGDGFVNGTGTGPVATDDVSFFIAHWLNERRVNGIVIGDLTSRTTLGDLNYDGRTSLADWNILRNAHASGASLDLEALLAAVPEPSTCILAMLAVAFWGFIRQRNKV